jgi:carboxymethylenebutenolidase
MHLRTLFATAALALSALAASAQDFNGDGKSDVVLLNAKTGAVAIALINDGKIVERTTVTAPAGGWRVVATGDLDHDGRSDLIAQNKTSIALWPMNGTKRVSEKTIATPKIAGWNVVGARDVNGDRNADLFLQNANGSLAIWEMNGATISAGRLIGTSADCSVAVGNFGGESLLLYNRGSKSLQRRLGSDAASAVVDSTAAFDAVAVGDFDGDGDDDLVQQSGASLKAQLFAANGAKVDSVANGALQSGWNLAGAGDYDGNGRDEILLVSASSLAAWQLDGTSMTQRWSVPLEADWRPLTVNGVCPEHVHDAAAPAAAAAVAATYSPKGSTVTFGEGSGYLSAPKVRGKRPAIIVIQEWWGLNDWIRQQTDRFSAQGYVALAVDLYRGRVATTSDEAHELSRGLPQDRGVGVLKAAFHYLAARPDVDAKHLGVIGWCMGGGYALNLAIAEPRLAAAVINYGALQTDPATLAKIQTPILGNFGALDRGIPPTAVTAFDDTMDKAGKSSDVKIYEGAGHAFMNPNNKAGYVEPVATDAWKRIDAFFAKRLGSS